MALNTRPLQFRDYLPQVYREGDGVQLTVQSVAGTTITVAPMSSGSQGFRVGIPVAAPRSGQAPLRTRLATAIPANTAVTQITVQDSAFSAALKVGDTLNVFNFLRAFLQSFEGLFEQLEAEVEGTADVQSGGIPDLFSPSATPPAQFANRAQPGAGDYVFLSYLATWLALSLRQEKSLAWNRTFFSAAIPLYSQRSTLPGVDALLRAWLQGELAQDIQSPILTDFAMGHTDATSAFQLGVSATLGVNTVLGDGPPFFFLADIDADPKVPALRTPDGIDVMQSAARFLLDSEKPANTYYRLQVSANTMQLAPPNANDVNGLPAAQIGVNTLLWKNAWVFDSD